MKEVKKTFGVSLIEMIMVVVIIGVSFPLVIKGLITAHVKQISTHRAQEFAYLIQEKMEPLIESGYISVTEATEDPISGFDKYKRNTYVSYVTADFVNSVPATSYKKIIVKVTHKSSGDSFKVSSVLNRGN